jgi:hypothetical protein
VARVRNSQVVEKTLQMGEEGFERYIDELVEECARLTQLVAQLRQLPDGESSERDKRETEFCGSLAHLKEHSASLSQLMEVFFCDVQLPKDFLEKPSTDFGITMDGNGRRASILVFPTSMAPFLTDLAKSEFARDPF